MYVQYVSSAGSRPCDKRGGGGGGFFDSEIRGGGGGAVSKIFFRPFGPQFGLEIRGGGEGRGPSPGSANGEVTLSRAVFQE